MRPFYPGGGGGGTPRPSRPAGAGFGARFAAWLARKQFRDMSLARTEG